MGFPGRSDPGSRIVKLPKKIPGRGANPKYLILKTKHYKTITLW
jgi:hypothetical protein